MKKTFLLGTKPSLFVFLSILFLSNASIAFFDTEQSRIEYWLMIANAIAGFYALFFTLLVLTDLVGTAPKVVVHNEGLLLKGKAFSTGHDIKWDEIKSISFHSYQIDLKLETKPLFFSYKSTAATSKRIKDAIRDMAELKQVPVTGGVVY